MKRSVITILLAGALAINTCAASTRDTAHNPFHPLRSSSLPEPDAPLKDRLRALIPLSDRGDVQASLLVYAGLNRCRGLRNHGNDDEAASYCTGVTPADIATAGHYLDVAAGAGDINARYIYSISGASEARSSAMGYLSDTSLRQIHGRERGYLDDLVQACHLDAMLLTFWEKRSGGSHFEADFYGAYVLQSVLNTIQPGIVKASDVRALEVQMIPTDIDRARTASSAFHYEACR